MADIGGIGALARRGGAAGFAAAFGAAQRTLSRGPSPRLFEAVPRLQDRLELAGRLGRLRDAAETLAASAPQAAFSRSVEEVVTGVETGLNTQTIETETEVTTPATPASQTSVAFASADEIIARNKSELHLELADGSDIKIKVGNDGASLNDLADLINNDSQNGGQVVASVFSDVDGFRLHIETTEVGAAAALTVKKDDFKTPAGDSFDLIDPALAREGKDEVTETETTTETVSVATRVVQREEIETKDRVDDDEFERNVAEFVDAFNALRAFADAQREQDGGGLLAEDAGLLRVALALDEIAGGLEERASEAGTSLADIGIAFDDEGHLALDAERLQNAIETDTDSVFELLDAESGGLGADVAAALAPEEPAGGFGAANAALSASIGGFLEAVTSRQDSLEERLGLLEQVASALGEAGA